MRKAFFTNYVYQEFNDVCFYFRSVYAPEVIMTHESDVYSYGILLVEIVGGRYIQSIVEQVCVSLQVSLSSFLP